MDIKKCLLASLPVFVFIFAFEWVFHGVIMKESYLQTAYLWRSQQDMPLYLPWMIAGQLLFSFIFTIIFAKGYENKGIAEGIRYGMLMAMLFTASLLIGYAVTPYPADMMAAWIIALLVELPAAGVLLSFLYKPKT